MTISRFRYIVVIAVIVTGLTVGWVHQTAATVVFGNSTAFGESILVTFVPNSVFANLGVTSQTFTSGSLPFTTGSAPLPYNNPKQALNVSLALPAPTIPLLTLGTLGATGFTVNASSNVDGLPGVRQAHADATAASLVLNLGLTFPAIPLFSTAPTTIPLLSIGFDTLGSSVDVSGDFGALLATGGTTLAGASISVPLFPSLALSVPLTVLPNTDLIPPGLGLPLGIRLNEQILGGNGINTRALDVNAIHISFMGVPILPFGDLSGDIIISHADARLLAVPPAAEPVPEPSTLVLCSTALLGLTGLSFFRSGYRS